jgi:hypothetical protein
MLVGYFDESGTHDGSPIVCMAGYVASAEQWTHFTRNWNERFNRDCSAHGIQAFHMTDYQAKQKGFENLTNDQWSSLLPSLIMMINVRIEKAFGVAFLISDYEEVIGPYRTLFARGPWGFCAMLCVVIVKEWAKRRGLSERIDYVFDQGARYSGQVIAALNGTTEDFHDEFLMGAVALGDRRLNPPLQAADILAYESYKHNYNKIRHPDVPVRKSLAALLRVQPIGFFLSRETLEGFVERIPESSLDARWKVPEKT